MITQDLQPYVSAADQAPVQFLGIPTVLRATAAGTSGAFGLIEHLSVRPGFASPYHTHHKEDESFYIIEGEMAVCCGGKWMVAGAGAFVFLPRDVPHGFKITGDTPARLLLLVSPGGFEQFVIEMSAAHHAPMAELAAKYHVDVHGALPLGSMADVS
jgi:quercetin dioxygenase-like cupin family protein